MALLEIMRIAGELVGNLAPWIIWTRIRDEFPMPMNLNTLDQRHQL